MEKRSARLFSRHPLAFVLLANALVYICPAIYTTFLSAYFTRLGFSAGKIGLLFSLSPLMYLLASPRWARLADHSGKRSLVLAGICAGAAVSLVLLPFTRGFVSTFLVMLLLDIFVTSLVPLSDSIVLMQSRAIGIPFSTVRLGGTIGYALVVILCGFFLRGSGRAMFPAAAFAFLLYALLILAFPREQAAASLPGKTKRSASLLGMVRGMQPEFLFLLAFAFLGYTGLSVLAAYLGAFMVKLGYGHLEIAIASTISALSEIPTLLLIQRYLRKQPVHRILFLSCTAFALRLVLVSSGTLPMIYGSSLLQSLSYMPLYYCCVTYVSAHLPDSQQSQGQSLLVLCQSGLGGMTGYLLGGQAVAAWGAAVTYRVTAVLITVFASALYAWYLHTQRKDVHHG